MSEKWVEFAGNGSLLLALFALRLSIVRVRSLILRAHSTENMERTLNSDISIVCVLLDLINVVKNFYNFLYCDELRTCGLNSIVPFLIACFNYCALLLASEIVNLLIAFAFYKVHKVCCELDAVCISNNCEHNRNS